tara:strand:+ start:447 stop:740 length:294 start_codon:yes stop_codon:yes gene_type:complete
MDSMVEMNAMCNGELKNKLFDLRRDGGEGFRALAGGHVIGILCHERADVRNGLGCIPIFGLYKARNIECILKHAFRNPSKVCIYFACESIDIRKIPT